MLPVRPELVGQEPYGAPQLDVPVRLNVNENPFPLPPVVVDAVTEATRGLAAGLNRYPTAMRWPCDADSRAIWGTASMNAISGPPMEAMR